MTFDRIDVDWEGEVERIRTKISTSSGCMAAFSALTGRFADCGRGQSRLRRSRATHGRRYVPMAKVAFAFGGGSELGREYLKQFKDAKYEVCSVDSFESPECDHSLCLPHGAPARAQLNFASRMIGESFNDQRPFDVMMNTTIGFDAEGIDSDDIFDSFDYLLNTNVRASLVTARLAMQHLKPGGILVFLGSVAAFSPTKSLGYSAGKAALHQMVRNLALSVGDEFPEGVRIIGIVPVVLDTQIHRNLNSGRSEMDWTPTSIIVSKLLAWAENPIMCPENGSLVQVTSEEIQVSEGKKVRQHLFRLIETPSFIKSRLL